MDLRGDYYDERDAEEEPLVLEEPEEEAGVAAGGRWWRRRIGFDGFLHRFEGMMLDFLGFHGKFTVMRNCATRRQQRNQRKSLKYLQFIR